MSPAVRFVPAERDELREVAAWYEERRSGLGDQFVDAVEAALELILDGRRPEHRWRWALMTSVV